MFRNAAFLAGFVLVALVPQPAAADGSAYCTKTRARAAADAALMFAPSVHAQGLRFPRNGFQANADTRGQVYQVRGMLSLSPLDIYRGTRVRDAAEADCRRDAAEERLLDWADFGLNRLRAKALQVQLTLLDERTEELEAHLTHARERFEKRLITLAELHDVIAVHGEVMKKRVELRAEIARTQVEASDGPPVDDIEAAQGAHQASSMELERKLTHIRALDAWQVLARGGLVADDPVDYFGMLEVSYNFGGPARSVQDRKYLAAREEELRTSRRSLSHRVDVVRDQLRITREQLLAERDVLEQQAQVLAQTRSSLEVSQIPSAAHMASLVTMRELLISAEMVYLSTFAEELNSL